MHWVRNSPVGECLLFDRKMQGILIQVNPHPAFVSAPRPKWSEN
jgi:hypothetical protein